MAKRRAVSLIVRSLPWVAFLALVLAIVATPEGGGVAAFKATDGASPMNGDPTRLLRTPTVSATHIAFAYANNIWIVERAGGMARRLTSFQGADDRIRSSRPTASGSRSAASTPATSTSTSCAAEGGEPKRLTWHPGADVVQGWTPDGKSIALRLVARDLGAERRAALLDRAGRGRRRSSRWRCRAVSGQDLARRHAHRLSHEQLVGRRAPQLSRRPEPADLDRRSEDLRPRVAAVDRLEGHRSRLGRRHRLLHLRSRRRRERLGVSRRRRRSSRRSRSSPTST